MPSFQDKWATLHELLSEDYVNTDGTRANCYKVSKLVGAYLIEEGKEPWQYHVSGGLVHGRQKRITPRPYADRLIDGRIHTIQWLQHAVTVDSGLVYDPMLVEPIEIDSYPAAAFFESVTLSPHAEIARLLDISQSMKL